MREYIFYNSRENINYTSTASVVMDIKPISHNKNNNPLLLPVMYRGDELDFVKN